VGDEIDLEEAGPGIIPVGEGAEGDLVLEPGARPGRRQSPRGASGAGGSQEALEGRGAGVTEAFRKGGGEVEAAEGSQASEEFGDEGVEAMGAPM
jgi:hypothetical protein